MRKLKTLLLAVVAIGASIPAGASMETLVSATLAISIGALPPIQFPINSIPTMSVSIGGGFTEPASLFTGTLALPTALFTGVAQINGLTLANIANGTKFIAQGAAGGTRTTGVLRAGGGLGGPGPLAGTALINVLGSFNLAVPLNVIGNSGATTIVGTAQMILITVQGTGWTTGPVTLTGAPTGSPAVNSPIFVGYDNRDANHGGVIQLISPFKVITNVAGNLPGLATQTLTFIGDVPEPGTLLLLGTGVVGLAIYGGWRRSRR